MKRLSIALILLAGCTEQTSWHTAHDAQEKRIEALEQKLAEPKPPRVPVTIMVNSEHAEVDSPDFPLKVLNGKFMARNPNTGEWVKGQIDGNENVYVEAYHESNPNRRKRFVFVDGEWSETIYDVEEAK